MQFEVDVGSRSENRTQIEQFCDTNSFSYADQKSLMNYVIVITDGERVATKVKGFITTITNLTTDFLLREFSKQSQYQEVSGGNAQEQETQTIEDLDTKLQKQLVHEFEKVQNLKEDPKKQLEANTKNLNEYLQFKKRHEYNENAAFKKQAIRAKNISHYKKFVGEW